MLGSGETIVSRGAQVLYFVIESHKVSSGRQGDFFRSEGLGRGSTMSPALAAGSQASSLRKQAEVGESHSLCQKPTRATFSSEKGSPPADPGTNPLWHIKSLQD